MIAIALQHRALRKLFKWLQTIDDHIIYHLFTSLDLSQLRKLKNLPFPYAYGRNILSPTSCRFDVMITTQMIGAINDVDLGGLRFVKLRFPACGAARAPAHTYIRTHTIQWHTQGETLNPLPFEK